MYTIFKVEMCKKKRKKTRLDCGEIYSSSCNAKDYINYVLRTTRWLKYIDNLYNLVHVVAIPKESFMFLAVLVYFSPVFCFMLSKCYEILKKIFHHHFEILYLILEWQNVIVCFIIISFDI